MELVCKKCGYVWNTNSKARRISCSKCKTSITIHTPQQQQQQQQPKLKTEKIFDKIVIDQKARGANFEVMSGRITGQPKELMDVKFPLALWRDVRLRQRIDHAPSLGDDHIVLKVDNDGILYLG